MMEKENSRSAAGLRRSAIVERLRLKQEWLALKDTGEEPLGTHIKERLPMKKHNPYKYKNNTKARIASENNKENHKFPVLSNKVTSEVLRGIVVLVNVGAEKKALPLRAALTALGATVVPTWSPLVTHLVWTQGGCRNVRAKARVLACRLVSPLWVEACASSGRRLPENVFPAPTRPSDLPSPATLKRLLKKAEYENLPLADLLSDSQNCDKHPRLRISSENDTTNSTDKSHDTSKDTSVDKSKSKDKSLDSSRDSPNESVRVNTAPRRALPMSMSPERPMKSKRKLFTQREPDLDESDDGAEKETPRILKNQTVKFTPTNRRKLAQAERMARRLVGSISKSKPTDKHARKHADRPNIVLTGMTGKERQNVCIAISTLNGRIQSHVNRKTTHILLGSCIESSEVNHKTVTRKPCLCPERTLSKMFSDQLKIDPRSDVCPCQVNSQNILHANISNDREVNRVDQNNELINQNSHINDHNSHMKEQNGQIYDLTVEINGQYSEPDQIIENISSNCQNGKEITQNQNCQNEELYLEHAEVSRNVQNGDRNMDAGIRVPKLLDKPRTVNALLGAVRGCRVLCAGWALESMNEKRWLPYFGYEVSHLKKICQKARVERSALGLLGCEYAYNIFRGMRVFVTLDADQKDAILHLLTLCGAVVQNGGLSQKSVGLFKNEITRGPKNGGLTEGGDFDVTIGKGVGEVCSKWVFDSVAASRMRTTRRYINKDVALNIS